jgi:branched-chain amino acid transport system ATP-binding protein
MTMVLEPTILMFDGPTPGMSVNEVPAALDLIARLKTDETKTIHLVEHKMGVVRSFADCVTVLNRAN